MRTMLSVLSLMLLAGLVVVPVATSDAHGWNYGFSFYAGPVYGYYGPGYYYPSVYRYYYPPAYRYYGYYPPVYGYYGPRHQGYYGDRGHGRGWYRGYRR
jgi:hypothetical protein